jgi:uncharacterized membrane protein
MILPKKIDLHRNLRYRLPVLFCILITGILWFLPTGFEGALQFRDAVKCHAEILSVYNDRIIDTGLVRSGQQICTIRFLSGRFKGQTSEGYNLLNGSLESDKIFQPGDRAQCVVHFEETDSGGIDILSVNLIDHYRLDGEVILLYFFAVFLLVFAGETGLRALLSFVITILCIWKILVPLFLRGWNPLRIGLGIALFLTVTIIALVYGFDRRCVAASAGSFLGVLVTAVLGIVSTQVFKIHGAVMSYSESLLYSGFQYLNLTQIFMAGIFIGASGAMMDLSVDITSAIHEIVRQNPGISTRQACLSGMNVARAAMGTMTTTLLLAYSGGYIALLMVFMAQGTPLVNILNYRYVASEIIHTIAGSFGLVTVGPFTAMTAGFLLTRKRESRAKCRYASPVR